MNESATQLDSFNTKRITSGSNKNKTQSYENLLINKYLDDIQQTEFKKEEKSYKKSNLETESPYLQKLSHSNFVKNFGRNGVGKLNSYRKLSSRANSERSASNFLEINEKYEPYSQPLTNNNNISTNSTNINNNITLKTFGLKDNNITESKTNLALLHLSLRQNRPSSAPIRKSPSLLSYRLSSRKSNKPVRNKQPKLIKAIAFRNGNRQQSANIAAKNLAEFLEIATHRLELSRAARRIFLENGDEIKHESQFFRKTVVYVSCGEDFIDPFSKTKDIVDKRKAVLWTSNGVHFLSQEDLAENNEELKTNLQLVNSNSVPKVNKSKLKETRQTKRIVAYENGSEHNPSVVVIETVNNLAKRNLKEEDIEKLEREYLSDFLEECSNRLKFSGNAKFAYNWDGHLVRSISDIPKLDKCLQSILYEVEYAPVWISKGEGFDSRGALFFVENLLKFTKVKRKEQLDKKAKHEKNLKIIQEEQMQIKTSAIRIIEINEALKPINSNINEFNKAIATLEAVHSNLQSLNSEQINNNFESIFKHIKEIKTNEKIFGGMASKGVKLKVFFNGTDDSIDIFFNLKDWSMSNEKSENQKSHLYQLLSDINQKVNKTSTKAIKFTRVFNEFGEEIKQVTKLTNNEKIWVSQGENWIGEGNSTTALSINTTMLYAMRNNFENYTSIQPAISAEKIPEPKVEIKKYDEDNDSLIDDESEPIKDEKEEELTNFFKHNSPKKSFSKNDAVVPTNDSRAIKIYIEPLKINMLKNYEKSDSWDVLNKDESTAFLNEIAHDFRADLIKEDHSELDRNKTENLQILIQNKTDPKLILYPRMLINDKFNRNGVKNDSVWLHDFQFWKFTKTGFIYNQFFPKICLTLNTAVTVQLEFHLKNNNQANKKKAEDSLLDHPQLSFIKKGYAVILDIRHSNNEVKSYRDQDQQWSFNKHGNICSQALDSKEMVLTCSSLLLKELENLSRPNGIIEKYDLQILDINSTFKQLDPSEMCIFMMESFDNVSLPSLLPTQRWAIKQENSLSIGEWRFSELSTALWHKMALTWPVDENEKLIDKFRWPLNGCLIPGAPPLKNFQEISDTARTRLRVLKNGSVDISSALTLSRMDVKHLMKEFIHCTKISYRQFEFNVFLDTCTSAFNFHNAARRLFESDGTEIFDLFNLKQDQIIYVSTGEAWIPPKLVREEQDKKTLLNNLTDDLTKIAFYNKLKDCFNFVIETSNMTIQEGSKLKLGGCCLSFNQIERIKQGESIQHVIEIEEVNEEEEEEQIPKKFHQISHENVDAADAKKFRWPWENIANKSMEGIFNKKIEDKNNNNENEENDNNDLISVRDSLSARKSFDNDMHERFRTKSKRTAKNAKLNSQKFAYDKKYGFIYSIENPNLVFGVVDIDNNLNEVFLMKKIDDNVNQRWIYKDSRFISKARSSLALTVKLPQIESIDIDLNTLEEEKENLLTGNQLYKKSINNEASIILQPFIDSDYGNAHQRWYIDEDIGFIYAFATQEEKNIEITAANKANICTYYITNEQEISQPGYICEIIKDSTSNKQTDLVQEKVEKVYICLSCARTIRGKFRITKFNKNHTFSCYVGRSKEKAIKQFDGFKYLTNKVDLSSSEAENSFTKWQSKLISWRQESNAKTVLNQISATKTLTMVKLFAYKNGDGRLKQGEFIVGSSIPALLEQATNRLQLRNAARRLYTEDGTLILDIQDLIDWAIDYYRRELAKMDAASSEAQKKEMNGSTISLNKIQKQYKIERTFSSSNLGNYPLIKEQQQLTLLDKVNFNEKTAPKSQNDNNDSNTKKIGDDLSPENNNNDIPKNENANKQDNLLDNKLTKSYGSIFTNNSSLSNLGNMPSEVKVVKQPFNSPSKTEIKRLLNEYDRSSRIDPKKVLRWPIEIWVSSGEPFVQPKLVSKNETQKMIQREQVDKAEHELEKQTHALRQMTGRRLTQMKTGQYKPIKNPDYPVVKEGHWSEVPYEEQVKQNEVNELKNYVDELKYSTKKIERNYKNSTQQLFGSHLINKRVLVYINGQAKTKAQYCWASSIEELNEAAKLKLRLTKPVKFCFTEDGKIISRFEDIHRDQYICVSTGREFIPAELRNKDVELKANWSRMQKEEGWKATNIHINSRKNPIVDVDPFGPPVLNLNDQRNIPSLKLALPSTEPEIKYNKTISEISSEDKPNKHNNTKTNSILKKGGSFDSSGLNNTDSKQNLSRSKREKGTSASPKRVQISNDNSNNTKLYSGVVVDSDDDYDVKRNKNETNFDMLD